MAPSPVAEQSLGDAPPAAVAHGLSSRNSQALAHSSVVASMGLALFTAHGIFLTKGQTLCPCTGRQTPIHCTTKEVLLR